MEHLSNLQHCNFMHLYSWLLPNVHLKGKNFIDIYLINKEIIKNILSRLLETDLFEKKRINNGKFSLFTRSHFSCHFVWNIFVHLQREFQKYGICMIVLFWRT